MENLYYQSYYNWTYPIASCDTNYTMFRPVKTPAVFKIKLP